MADPPSSAISNWNPPRKSETTSFATNDFAVHLLSTRRLTHDLGEIPAAAVGVGSVGRRLAGSLLQPKDRLPNIGRGGTAVAVQPVEELGDGQIRVVSARVACV